MNVTKRNKNDCVVINMYQKESLRSVRHRYNLTQEEIANQCGISRPAYTLIETGKRRPSAQVAQKIAKVLGFSDKWYMLLEKEDVTVEKEIVVDTKPLKRVNQEGLF